VVGASAGGVEALRAMVAGLPADLRAAVLVVLHVPREAPSALPRILDRAGPLSAQVAVDGEPLTAGRIYVAPADHHLLVLGRRVRLSRGPSENGHRPAIDPLFRSAARAAGSRVIAVVLSGSRDDGAAGAATVVAAGGTVVVQDPEDALYPSMPGATIARTGTEHIVKAAKLGGLVAELITEPVSDPDPVDDPVLDAEVAIDDLAAVPPEDVAGTSTVYGCPACGGGLYEVESNPMPRFRCRVGHAWSPESLLEEQAVATEGALWMALRALEEKSALSRRMAGTVADDPGEPRFVSLAEDADTAGALIRDLLSRLTGRLAPDEQ
jgi:two-component system chemotaxis response regulator CheB